MLLIWRWYFHVTVDVARSAVAVGLNPVCGDEG
jgi:hypothetical protein